MLILSTIHSIVAFFRYLFGVGFDGITWMQVGYVHSYNLRGFLALKIPRPSTITENQHFSIERDVHKLKINIMSIG